MTTVCLSQYKNATDELVYQVLVAGLPITAATSNKFEAAKIWEKTWAATSSGSLIFWDGETMTEPEVWETK